MPAMARHIGDERTSCRTDEPADNGASGGVGRKAADHGSGCSAQGGACEIAILAMCRRTGAQAEREDRNNDDAFQESSPGRQPGTA